MTMESKKGKVIPFAQSATFYMKRGARNMERNDLLGALHRYRLAHQAAPDEAAPTLALAEILSYMQRFEESNRLILQLIARGAGTPECHFGLACNYFGMREYDYAVESLENYLDSEPDGPYAADAEDFLDLLDDDLAMLELAGLMSDADYDANAACVYARHLMDAGDYAAAVALLKSECRHEPDSVMLKNQLTLAYVCGGERAKAAGVVQELMDSGKDDILTRCNFALLCLARGERQEADEAINALLSTYTESPDALHSIAVLLMETERFSEAANILEQLMKIMPYDENVLHKLGLCRYRLKDFTGAESCYKRLLRIDPEDTIARYYLTESRVTDADERRMRSHWVVQYQVPFAETFKRLAQINRSLLLPEAEQRALWENDKHFMGLLRWALTLPDLRVKKSILSLLYIFKDERAEALLRDFLLRAEQPDEQKRMVFGMLKDMGAREPYMAYLNGHWLQGRVNFLNFSYQLPGAYEAIIRMLLEDMGGMQDQRCLTAAAAIYKRYIESLQQKFPRISSMQAVALVAALELLGSRHCDIPVSEESVRIRYRISATRLRNAVQKLEPFVEEESGPEDTES